MNERRHFLRNLALAAAVVAVKPMTSAIEATSGSRMVSTKPAPTAPTANSSRALDYAAFVRCHGSQFQVHSPVGDAQSLALEEVRQHLLGKKVDAFSVIFRGNAADRLNEGTYRFSHPDLGQFDLFIQPGAEGQSRTSYGAAFCRLV